MNNSASNLIASPPNATLADIVRRRGADEGQQIAYTFLGDGENNVQSLTWAELDRRARQVATTLVAHRCGGKPVLLALHSGLTFIESLFGCWYAGAIAVPVSLPRHQRVKHRLDKIIADAGADFALGTAETRARLESDEATRTMTAAMTWVDPASATEDANLPPSAEPVALLQYTSGSTGTPRGVIVTHSNLTANSAIIAAVCGHAPGQTIAGWLPMFHDMGLVGLVQAAYSGARCIFMTPERFLMRPWLWLKMISDYRACTSPAPNFAYDLCAEKVKDEHKAGLDLSCWRNALNGSEPVRAATLDRFSAAFAGCGFAPQAFFPCYGMAESTLYISGPALRRIAPRRSADGTLLPNTSTEGHVACGAPSGDTRLVIVDPATSRLVPGGAVGEIWISGASIAAGYWNNPQATAAAFSAILQDDTNKPDATKWLRTGDLGFISDGELFITGRLRELIIVAGRNHFPVDIEKTVESADPAIATFGAAAFSVDVQGAERLIVVAEVRREFGKLSAGKMPADKTSGGLEPEAVARKIRAAVASGHDLAPHDIVLLRPGALPRTTSGKVSRRETRDGYLNQSLERLLDANYVHAAP